MYNTIQTLKKHQFLFEELVKRDFKQKYKRTILGMGWSILSPLLTLLVLNWSLVIILAVILNIIRFICFAAI